MAITPEQARAELQRRGLSLQTKNTAPAPEITPEQARQELQKREELKRDYPARRFASKYLIRPLVEGGAMTLGGSAGAIAGAPAGPIVSGLAGVAGGMAMYPPAHEAVNRLDEYLGIGGRRKPVGDLERTLGELQTGLEIETGGRVLGSAVKKGLDLAVRGGVPTFLGPSREAVAKRIENPEVLKNASSYLEQAERLPKTVGNIQKAIDKTSDIADSKLSNSNDPINGAVPISRLTSILSNLQEGLKVGESTVGASDKAATGRIGALISDVNDIIKRPIPAPILGPSGQPIVLKQVEGFIPEVTLKKAIQRIRKDINFSDKGASVTNSVLTDVSGQLDSILKTGNKPYAKAMRPVSQLMRIFNDAIDKFSLTRNTGEGIKSTNETISAMKALPQERRGISQKTMGRIKGLTGEDYVQNSKNRALSEQFTGGNAQGTRRTAGGAIIGSAIGALAGYPFGASGVGSTAGSVVGSIAGMASDVSGREFGAKIIDSYVKAKPWLAKLPYEIVVRLISSGKLGDRP